LLAHLHAASHDPSFAVGGMVSRDHIPAAMAWSARGMTTTWHSRG
jgi:hypothetical protein